MRLNGRLQPGLQAPDEESEVLNVEGVIWMANGKQSDTVVLEELMEEDRNRERRYLHNDELHHLYFSQNILRVITAECQIGGGWAVMGDRRAKPQSVW
jgi:hypothetical protein